MINLLWISIIALLLLLFLLFLVHIFFDARAESWINLVCCPLYRLCRTWIVHFRERAQVLGGLLGLLTTFICKQQRCIHDPQRFKPGHGQPGHGQPVPAKTRHGTRCYCIPAAS